MPRLPGRSSTAQFYPIKDLCVASWVDVSMDRHAARGTCCVAEHEGTTRVLCPSDPAEAVMWAQEGRFESMGSRVALAVDKALWPVGFACPECTARIERLILTEEGRWPGV